MTVLVYQNANPFPTHRPDPFYPLTRVGKTDRGVLDASSIQDNREPCSAHFHVNLELHTFSF